ncbi:hypothetical protein IAU60_002980 [Kwoniella sp. DSM 27419]
MTLLRGENQPLATSSYINPLPPKLNVVRNPATRVRQAVRDNNVPLLSRLQHKTDLRNADKNRLTSLSWAAIEGSLEVFEWLLLDYGHDDQELSRDADNNTILHLLASVPSLSPSPYTYQLSSPAFPARQQTLSAEEQSGIALRMTQVYHTLFPFLLDWSNSGGKTALHVAAQAGNWRFISFLSELGADLDLTDLQGNTPLHYASAWGHLDTVRILLDRGCGYGIRNFEGFTASDFAFSERVAVGLNNIAKAVHEERKARRKESDRSMAQAQAQAQVQAQAQAQAPGQARTQARSQGQSPTLPPSSSSNPGPSLRQRSESVGGSSIAGSSSFGQTSYHSQPGIYHQAGQAGFFVPSHDPHDRFTDPMPDLPLAPPPLLGRDSDSYGYGERSSSLPMSRLGSASTSASASASNLSYPKPMVSSGSSHMPPSLQSRTSNHSAGSVSSSQRPTTSTSGTGTGTMGPPPLPPQAVLGRPTPPLQGGTLQPPRPSIPGPAHSQPGSQSSSQIPLPTLGPRSPSMPFASRGQAQEYDLAPPLPYSSYRERERSERVPTPPDAAFMRRANSAQSADKGGQSRV